MKYYKMIQYGEGENYETKETIITEDIFIQYRDLIAQGKEKLVLKDRIISVSSIKEIVPADDIVAEYQQVEVSDFAKLPPADKPKITGKVESENARRDRLSNFFHDLVKDKPWNQ